MKVSFEVHKPVMFSGYNGDKFVKKMLDKRIRQPEKTKEIVDLIKSEFKLKDNANDILEALVYRIKELNRFCNESESTIEQLTKEKDRLERINNRNESEIRSKEYEIYRLKYRIHTLKK